ncbi:O-antigen polymerase [Mannheimia massilioguelmaensis]|uniref:O-antigen polymerase n=1 Tax=Mannheimia massilioguelmaensis TaxID=1604354 RepID=UPI0005C8AAD1|nr:O-antigen polymerase [Mannheimia massilioguelmaensis]
MFLYLLSAILLLLLIFNLVIVKFDYMHPSVLFIFSFFVSSAICVLGASEYEIVFHQVTVLVVVSSCLIFTLITLCSRIYDKSILCPYDIKEIKINKFITLGFIFLFIITQFSFIEYLQSISLAYLGRVGSLAEMISLYDVMTKFWTDIFRDLNISVPLLYRIGNPITQGFGYLVVYICIHNYIATKKIDFLHLIIILLLCINIVFNGSRSPIFRVITMMLVTFYLLYNRKYALNRGSILLLVKILIILLFSGISFIFLLHLMGRENNLTLFHYLFIYLGAPLVNFDNYLASRPSESLSLIFGEQTFRVLYAYIGKITSNPDLIFPTIDVFTFSNNGFEIGNVYTTFYAFIYDFAYKGFMPLILLIGLYYIFTYEKIKKVKLDKVSFMLFVYAYLFNDILMLSFSNRFYSTIFDASFIKIIVFAYFFSYFFVRRKSANEI